MNLLDMTRTSPSCSSAARPASSSKSTRLNEAFLLSVLTGESDHDRPTAFRLNKELAADLTLKQTALYPFHAARRKSGRIRGL